MKIYLSLAVFICMLSEAYSSTSAWQNIKQGTSKAYDITTDAAGKTWKVVKKGTKEIYRNSKSAVNVVSEKLPDTMKIKKKGIVKYLPNTLEYKPLTYHHLNFSSTYKDAEDYSNYYKDEIEDLSVGQGISINKIYKPEKYWTWLLKWSASATYMDVKKPDDFKFFHAFLGGSLIWNFTPDLGSIALKAGMGPMYVYGTLGGKKERKWTIAPGLKLSYYNFITENTYVLLNWKLIPIIGKDVYRIKAPKNEYHYLEAINVLSLNLGYYVF